MEYINPLKEASKNSIRFEDLYPRDQWENIADAICDYIKEHLVSKKYPDEPYWDLGIEKLVSKKLKKCFNIKEDIFTMNQNMSRFKKVLLEKFFPNMVPWIRIKLDYFWVNAPGWIRLDWDDGSIVYDKDSIFSKPKCVYKFDNNDSLYDRNSKHCWKIYGFDSEIYNTLTYDERNSAYDDMFYKMPLTDVFTEQEIKSLSNKIYEFIEKENNRKRYKLLDTPISNKINNLPQLKEQIEDLVPTMNIWEFKTIDIDNNYITFWISYDGWHMKINGSFLF